MMNRTPVHYTEVLQAWREADNSRVGDSMLVIFWNVCPVVTQWYRVPLSHCFGTRVRDSIEHLLGLEGWEWRLGSREADVAGT